MLKLSGIEAYAFNRLFETLISFIKILYHGFTLILGNIPFSLPVDFKMAYRLPIELYARKLATCNVSSHFFFIIMLTRHLRA
jgi:hypothetical protein